jgi:beta-barrel assembly-enhancing protease
VQARYHDGRTTAVHAIEVVLVGDSLHFRHGDADQDWPLSLLEVEPLGEAIRLGLPGQAARLLIEADAWREICAARPGLERGRRRKAWTLVAGLSAVAAAAAAIIFIGVPIASGPLGRGTPPELERQIGDNLGAQINLAFPTCTGKAGQAALQAFGARLQPDPGAAFPLRVRAVEAPVVNAFALPGGAILVTDDLIDMADTPDELAAVIAHEAAHVELRHVMQGVWRSFGFGVVLDALVGGGTGAGQQAVLLFGSFTSLRYTRDAEAQADTRGQALLQAAGLSSQGMAPFFERLIGKHEGAEAKMVKELVSSHPDTLRRAQLSRARARPGGVAFDPADWAAIKDVCRNNPKRRLIPAFGH